MMTGSLDDGIARQSETLINYEVEHVNKFTYLRSPVDHSGGEIICDGWSIFTKYFLVQCDRRKP